MATKSRAPRQDTPVRFTTNPPASQWGSGSGRRLAFALAYPLAARLSGSSAQCSAVLHELY